jgi:hypothetical protein
MLGVAEGKERAFGGGNLLSFRAFMVPRMSGIVFLYLLQAFHKNLRELKCKKWLILYIYPDFMVSSGSFLYICATIQNNHMKKHNNMFFFVSMSRNRIKIEIRINNNDELLETIGEHMREI